MEKKEVEGVNSKDIIVQLLLIKDLLKECQSKYNKIYYKHYYRDNKTITREKYYKKKRELEQEKADLYKQFLEQTEQTNWKEYYRNKKLEQ